MEHLQRFVNTINGIWSFDSERNLIVLHGIGFHLRKDYRACGGAPKLKEKEGNGAKSKNIFATVNIEQCFELKRIEFVQVNVTAEM